MASSISSSRRGNVTTDPDYALRDPSNLLIGQVDGTFREAAEEAGILSFDRGRGGALADFNRDGLLDLIEGRTAWRQLRLAEREIILIFSCSKSLSSHSLRRWATEELRCRITQPAPNVDAIGAWVEVRVSAVAS